MIGFRGIPRGWLELRPTTARIEDYRDVVVTYEDEIDCKDFAWGILAHLGYNYALSDVEDACLFLGHPMRENEEGSKWKDPWPVRCYCGEIAYKNEKRYRCYNARSGEFKEGDEVR
jgi:hypothetical protein